MRVPLHWLREYAPTDLDPEALAETITHRGVKVEAIERPWEGLDGVVVARVLEVRDHPDSDKLCLARIQHGAGETELVVGVRNMVAGDLVPWAPPGSRVPVLDEPLGRREIRGVVSDGMLCSPRELAISGDHAGILVLADPSWQVGADVKAVLGLDEAVFDIEVEPNRPDFLSIIGVAREVAAATGVELRSVDLTLDETTERAEAEVSVRVEAPEACPRYLARVIRGVTHRPSPLWVQARLTASGMRPIDAVVDATNYAMLELGQPLHAFDLHRVEGPGIVVRRAAEDEVLQTLDGVDRVMTGGDLLICDLERPVAIAGVMGGATSEVAADTTDVLLESAAFTRTGILRTARRLDLHTEASHRFERGSDPEALEVGAARGAQLMAAWAGGTICRGIVEDGSTPPRRWVSMRPARASALLAYEVGRADAEGVFGRLRMANRSSDEGRQVEVEVPGYRHDIEREVDLIEEVARVLGYDRIGTHVPPTGQLGGAPPAYRFRARAVEGLVRAGLREVRLMTFASSDDLAMSGDTDAVPVANPLQAEEGFLRTRLFPGLVHATARNQAWGVAEVAIFEAGTVFRLAGEDVIERGHLAFALAGPIDERWYADARPLDALDASGVLGILMTELGVRSWRLGDPPGHPFHPGRAAAVLVGEAEVGVVGELHPRESSEREVAGRLAVCELELDALLRVASEDVVVREVPRYPPVRRDLAFVVADDVPAGDVQAAVEEAAGDMLGRCVLFDVFRGPPLLPGTKSLAFAVDLRAPDRTLTSEESEPVVAAIVDRVRRGFNAELRAG